MHSTVLIKEAKSQQKITSDMNDNKVYKIDEHTNGIGFNNGKDILIRKQNFEET